MEPNYKPAAWASQTLGEDCYDGSGGKAANLWQAPIWSCRWEDEGQCLGEDPAGTCGQTTTYTEERTPCDKFLFSEGGNGNRQFGRRPNVEMAGWHGGGMERDLRAGEVAAAGARLLMHVWTCAFVRVPLCTSCLKVFPPTPSRTLAVITAACQTWSNGASSDSRTTLYQTSSEM